MEKQKPETTGSSRNEDGTFKKGVSGNPNGRPKGSRHKLSEQFCEALLNDFAKNGAAAIEVMRAEKPNEYSKMIAGILTQEVEHTGSVQVENIKRSIVHPDD